MRTALSAVSALLLALLLAGCGFQLRGTADLPFDTLYVPPTGGIALDLKRNIRSGTRTTVVAVPAWMLRRRSSATPGWLAGGR